ncbi:hypothetical protein [Neorhodopirellula lusitana]|nr:hypothetical protein [Neorhodopirellula lusitana]
MPTHVPLTDDYVAQCDNLADAKSLQVKDLVSTRRCGFRQGDVEFGKTL